MTGTSTIISGNSYSITVGKGGQGGGVSPNEVSSSGDSSILQTTQGQVTVFGGGGGAMGYSDAYSVGQPGGSGGGGAATTGSISSSGGQGTQGQGTNGQSIPAFPGTFYNAGYGGGATVQGSFGGNGATFDITGVSITYGGGGAGGTNNLTPQVGGAGGGGDGGFLTQNNSYIQSQSGINGLGGGGGGGGGFTILAGTGNFNSGANGGSGVVILRFPSYS